MSAAELSKVFLRQAPKYLQSGLDSGAYRIFGSVIREAATGRIVGFLQEAAPLAPLLANPTTAVPAAAGLAAKLAVEAAQVVQVEAVRRGVDRVEAGVGRVENTLDVMDHKLDSVASGISSLQQIGLTNLAFSAAGVGISVVGFAAMAVKLDRIRVAIEGVSAHVEIVSAKIDSVRHEQIEADFAEIRALAKAYDEGWLLSDAGAERQWRQISHDALRFQTRFESRADHLLGGDVANYAVAEPMLDAISFASGLRVGALAAANETIAAQQAAADGARTIERLTGGIGLSDLARHVLSRSTAVPGSQEWAISIAAATEASRETARSIRQREAAIATKAAPLASLERRNITPRDWLAAARDEKETPLLLMMEDELATSRDGTR